MVRSGTVLVLLLFSLSWRVFADCITVPERAGGQRVDPAALYRADPTGRLTLKDVTAPMGTGQWRHTQTQGLSFGFTSSAYWIKFAVGDKTATARRLLVDVGNPLIDHIDAYIRHQDAPIEHLVLGDYHPFATRPLPSTDFVFPVSLLPKACTDIILRVKTTSPMTLPITLWSPNAFLAHTHQLSMLAGLMFGFLLCIVAYHVMLYVSIGERSFLYLALYALSILGYLACVSGNGFAFLWPSAVRWNDISVLAFIGTAIIFSNLFGIHILQLATSRPRMMRVLYTLVAVGVGCVVASFLLPVRVLVEPIMGMAVISVALNLLTYILRFSDRFRPAYYLMVASGIVALAIPVTFLAAYGVIPQTAFSQQIVNLGFCLQFLVFSLALASRMSLDRELRESAQEKEAEANRALLETQIHMTERLDQQVRERTQALEKANEQLKALSITDAVTQVHNRSHFDDMLQTEYRKAQQNQLELGLMLLDIDHFKRLNDTYGHPFGDRCLAQVAHLIQSSMRLPSDIVARYGGEEFAILLPGTTADSARLIAERIRRLIETTPVCDGQQQASVTISIGIVSEVPQRPGSERALLKRADVQLYKAKHQGRNRVVAEWDPDPQDDEDACQS